MTVGASMFLSPTNPAAFVPALVTQQAAFNTFTPPYPTRACEVLSVSFVTTAVGVGYLIGATLWLANLPPGNNPDLSGISLTPQLDSYFVGDLATEYAAGTRLLGIFRPVRPYYLAPGQSLLIAASGNAAGLSQFQLGSQGFGSPAQSVEYVQPQTN